MCRYSFARVLPPNAAALCVRELRILRSPSHPIASMGLVSIPAYRLNRYLFAPIGHPLLSTEKLELKDIAKYPLITYDDAFRSRRVVRQVFEENGLYPTVALQAIDPEICKTYVALGMGVAILPEIAYDEAVDIALKIRDAGHLFEYGVVNAYLRRGDYLRKIAYDFLLLLASHLTRETIDRVLYGFQRGYGGFLVRNSGNGLENLNIASSLEPCRSGQPKARRNVVFS